jgi:hypothetical protein
MQNPIKAFGELTAEHMPGVEIHDRHQISASLSAVGCRDVGMSVANT